MLSVVLNCTQYYYTFPALPHHFHVFTFNFILFILFGFNSIFHIYDIDPLELEGPFRCEKCFKEVSTPIEVFNHSSYDHKEIPLTSLNVRHISSNRVFLNTALFRYVLQCGVDGCNAFAGRNNSMNGALEI